MEKRGIKVIVWCKCRYTWIPHYTNHQRVSVTMTDLVVNLYGVIENNKLYFLDQDPITLKYIMDDRERDYFKSRFRDVKKFFGEALKEILSGCEVGDHMEVTPKSSSYSPNDSYTVGFIGLECHLTKRDDSLLIISDDESKSTALEKVYVSKDMGQEGPVQLEFNFE